jgi:hypothetical protein
VTWCRDHTNQTAHQVAELTTFRAEAETVLNAGGILPELVFAAPP